MYLFFQKNGIVSHPEYKSFLTYHDIALIRLSKDVSFTRNIRPACLYTNTVDNPTENHLTATGWGITNPDSKFDKNKSTSPDNVLILQLEKKAMLS